MREIPLTQGYVALVDEEDYEWLSQWKWYACTRQQGRTYAARNRSVSDPEGTPSKIYMHRALLGLSQGQEVDHKDRDGLNNQRENLRVTDRQGNQRNQKRRRDNTSGYCGVKLDSRYGTWVARITHNRKEIHLGTFPTDIDAAHAYDRMARVLHGDFASLNFPDEVAS